MMDAILNHNLLQSCLRVFKVLFLIMAFCIFSNDAAFAADAKPVGTLPPIVAQAAGPAFTIIFWHDVDDDGIPDYKATYIFKDGRLQLLEKSPPSLDYLGTKKRF
jgi:hypothetical protein